MAEGGTQHGPGINDLSDELLADIFGRLDQDDLRLNVLVVCKAWRRVGLLPELWRTLVVDLSVEDDPLFGPKAESFFRTRASGIESLALRPHHCDPGYVGSVVRVLRGTAPLKRLFLNLHKLSDDSQRLAVRALAWVDSPLEALCLAGLRGFDWVEGLGNMRLERLRVLHLHVYSHTSNAQRSGWGYFWYIPDALLGEGSPLEELMISNSFCKDSDRFMAKVGQLTRLTSLSFVHGGSGQVPQQWTALTNLRVLRVVTKLSQAVVLPDLTALQRLAVLDLSSPTVPPQLQSLRSLKHLTLRGLWVRTVAQEQQIAQEEQPAPASDAEKEQAFEALLGHGLQLETLRLVNCEISSVPGAVQRHTSLRSLTIRRCHLQRLPAGPYLELLRHLDLASNCLKHIPLTALAAPQLQTLRLLAYQPPVDLAAHRGTPQGLADAEELETAFLHDLTLGRVASAAGNSARSRDPSTKQLVREWAEDCHQHAPDERPDPFVAERLLGWVPRW